MISVIIPIYNQADKIAATLDSLIKQSYQDLEIIIVNDGSHDGLDLVLENYFKKIETKIPFMVVHQVNSGAPAARNFGFKKSRGAYLFFCDADAVLDYQALEIMLQNLNEHPEVAYVFSSFLWGKKLFRLEEFSEEKLKQMPYIHTMSLMRRECFPALGWDINIKKLQDWDLWLTMLEAGQRGFWINQILFKVTPGGHISSWLPAAAYSLFPFLPSVQKYNAAVKIIKTKHHLL
jgi:glycosyltransferase involved in cell wall biosynthesis